ncbi:MAG: hypothetical protein GY803_31805 [Chloroflexi bacterium]|nr:hypothetical protein [Chloroflexota bacterium]
MSLSLQVYDSPDKYTMLADYTHRIRPPLGRGLEFSTNKHGFAGLRVPFIPMSATEADTAVSWPGTPHAVVVDKAAGVKWEGRLDTIETVDGGLALTGLGYWQALGDVPYTALWSSDDMRMWEPVTRIQMNTPRNEKYQIQIQDEVTIYQKKGEDYAVGEVGAVGIAAPHGSPRVLTGVMFSYEFVCPSTTPTNWRVMFRGFNDDFGAPATVMTLHGSATPQAGAVFMSTGGRTRFVMQLFSIGSSSYTDETGEAYIRLTNFRVVTDTTNGIDTTGGSSISSGTDVVVTPADMTGVYIGQKLVIADSSNSEIVVVKAITATTFTADFVNSYSSLPSSITVTAPLIYADAIVGDSISNVAAVNPSQLQDSAALIESPQQDLLDEIYEDEYPTKILNKLATLHSYEAGVWEGQRLHFRERGSQGRIFYVDVTSLKVQRSLAALRNSTYATYQDANGRTLRTDVANDGQSIERFGLTRRAAVRVQTTSQAQAEAHRDAFLNDNTKYVIRAQVEFERLYTESGALVPLYELRAHDELILRNLPPTLSADLDQIRRFRVGHTSYATSPPKMRIEPAVPIPTLVTLIAGEKEGFG